MCNRCGSMNPANAVQCQNCGIPLISSRVESGSGARTGSQEQPGLPAWLESLRSSADTPSQSPSSFSAADLVDEGKLPSWMRPEERNDMPEQFGLSGQHSAIRPSSYQAPNTDESYKQPHNISASSLIDEQSLPSWMRQDRGGGAAPLPQQNINASSLVEPEYVPDWLKSMSASPLPPVQSQPSQSLQAQSAQSSQLSQGLSGRDMIDPHSLPDWMAQQSLEDMSQVASQLSSPSGASGQSGLPASSLLDMNALPSWLREAEHNSEGGQSTQAPQQAARFPYSGQQGEQRGQREQQSQQAAQQPWQAPGQQPFQQSSVQSAQSHSLSMASLIDMNALPEWLRSESDQHPHQQPSAQAEQQESMKPGTQPGGMSTNMQRIQGIPSRGENIRVPSRPRSQIGINEGNEVAANVFTSVLGVASNAPQFPSQPPSSQQTPDGTQGYHGRPVSPMPASSMPGQTAPTDYPRQHHQPAPQGYMNQAETAGAPATPSSWQQTSYKQQGQQAQQPPASGKPKRSGLFEAIRNLFFRQS